MIAGDRVSPGSVPEVIDDGVTGFVVNDDVEALAAIQLARDYLGHEKLLRDETRRALKLRPHAHEPIRRTSVLRSHNKPRAWNPLCSGDTDPGAHHDPDLIDP